MNIILRLQKISSSQPGLNGALFVERSGTKKREWKTEKAAQIIIIITPFQIKKLQQITGVL